MVVSWGLEGDGHFNSESWAQQHSLLMRERAVAYLSVERAVKGKSAYPTLFTSLYLSICLLDFYGLTFLKDYVEAYLPSYFLTFIIQYIIVFVRSEIAFPIE